MKKFLTILLALIVTVALGFTIFYIVRDNEEIYLSTSTLYVSKGDTFDIDINFKNKKSYTNYEVIVDKSTIVGYDESKKDDQFTALEGGYTKVLFRTSNVNYRNLDCIVYVGDGLSWSTPHYISSAEQLAQIGVKDNDGNCKYPLDAYYVLRNDIVLSDLAQSNLGYWSPIGVSYFENNLVEEEFTGHFDGRGYSIINMNLNKGEYNELIKNNQELYRDFAQQTYVNAGLFAKLGEKAEVRNVKFENANIAGSYTTAGLVAGTSLAGKVERVEVKSATLNLANTEVAGTIVGSMQSKLNDKIYTTASIDRCSANINLVAPSKVYGGIVGQNEGGYVVYSYVKGNANLYNAYGTNGITYGGIVGRNLSKVETYDSKKLDIGGHVKDCYTSVTLAYTMPEGVTSSNLDYLTVGGIVGLNNTYIKTIETTDKQETETKVNKLIGNYYNKDENKLTLNGTTNTYAGVGKFETNKGDSSTTETYTDTRFEVLGKTKQELTRTETFETYELNEEVVMWKFGTAWIEVYNEMPILDYSEQAVPADIYTPSDAFEVDEVTEFIEAINNYETGKPILITADLDFTGHNPWVVKDFNGIIYTKLKSENNGKKEYYKIMNLSTANEGNTNAIDYASMFATLGPDAQLHNITLENASFINGTYSAGFAYENNGLIDDCQIINSTITARSQAAGIAITNNGTISRFSYSTNNGTKYGEGVLVNNTNIKVESAELKGTEKVAGIACINNGNIDGVVVKGTENYSIQISANTPTSSPVTLGGIVSENYGSITNANISFVAASNGIWTNGSFTAHAGGIAAISNGKITQSFASANIYTSTEVDGTKSAGLVADIIDTGEIETSGFYGNNKKIEGTKAGGIAVDLSQSALRNVELKGWNAFWGSAVLKNDNFGTGIQQCYVTGSTIIKGKEVGGLAVNVTNGSVLHSYVGTGIVLTGVDNESKVANMALNVSINRGDRDGEKFSVGIIAYCYSDASFNNSGKSYGISSGDIQETPTGSGEKKKAAGYGYKLIVSESRTNGTKFFEGWFTPADWFGDKGPDNCRASDSKMHTTNGDSNKFRDYGFGAEIWSFEKGQIAGTTKSDQVAPTLSNALINPALLYID